MTEEEKNEIGIDDISLAKLIHGSVDYVLEGCVLGFHIIVEGENTPISLPLYIKGSGESFSTQFGGTKIRLQETDYVLMKSTDPPLLSDRWDIEKIRDFLKNPVGPENLYDTVKSAFMSYLELPKDAHYGLLTAWSVATYFAPLFPAFPFLEFFGPKETGKSKALEILNLTSFNSVKVKSITEAALCDTTEGLRGTVLIDQAEAIPKNLVGILADSYKRMGATRRIISRNGKRTVMKYSGFGPKAFATTKVLDSDLVDRCCQISMHRSNRQLPDIIGTESEWAQIRDMNYRFVLTKWRDVKEKFAETSSTGNRKGELWRPLIAVLKVLEVSDDEIEAVKEAFEKGTDQTRNSISLANEAVFQVLFDNADEGTEFTMTPTDIRDQAKPLLNESDLPDNRRIGTMIRQFSLAKEARRRTRRKIVHYVFDATHVQDIVRRYMEPFENKESYDENPPEEEEAKEPDPGSSGT